MSVPSRKPARRRWPLVATALIALGVGVVGTLWLMTYIQKMVLSPVRKFQLLIPGQLSLTHAAAIAPDGQTIAYVADGRLWLRPMEDLTPRMIPNSDGAALPFWSPGSDIVGYFNAVTSTLNALSVQRNTAVSMCRLPTPGLYGGATWRKDGAIIFSQGPSGLYKVARPGSEPQPFLSPEAEQSQDAGYYAPHILPDGETCVFAVWKKNGSWTIEAVLANGARRQIFAASSGDMVTGPVYAPSGHLLFNRMNRGKQRIWAMAFSLENLEVEGEPFPVTDEGSWPSVSSNNTLIYSASAGRRQQELVWIGRNGEISGAFGAPQEKLAAPALSPSDDAVAVAGLEHNLWDIWVYHVADGSRSRLTYDDYRESHPVWSGSGDHIAFMTEQGDAVRIMIMAADGTEERETVMKGAMDDLAPTWSRDGAYMVYQALNEDANSLDLWYIPLKQADRTPVLFTKTPHDEALPQFSPDGRYLAYQSNESGEWEVYLASFPDGKQVVQVSSGGGMQPRWSYKSEELFFFRQDRLMAAKVRTKPKLAMPSKPAALFQMEHPPDDPLEPAYDPASDGQRFLFVRDAAFTTVSTVTVVENWTWEFRNRIAVEAKKSN